MKWECEGNAPKVGGICLVCVLCSQNSAVEEAEKRFGFASPWPRPRWDPLAWAGAVTSCKASESAEISKEKRRVQPQPWGCEREQLSCGRDGKPALCPSSTGTGTHCKQLEFAGLRKAQGPCMEMVRAVILICLAEFPLAQMLLCSGCLQIKADFWGLVPFCSPWCLFLALLLSLLSPHETLLFFSEKVKR